MKSSIFINRILRNTFPINSYYHFSLVNLTSATQSATSYEHAHCAWYTKSLMNILVRSGWYLGGGVLFTQISLNQFVIFYLDIAITITYDIHIEIQMFLTQN